uniref:Ras-GAP domain-containing protein n=1 Tax=Rhabditophanes sp. KR3021 TaxID=114890 RepID=A0AC35UIJ0_9BILA
MQLLGLVLDYCPFRTREATNSVEQQDLSNTGKPFKFLERSANKQTVLIFSFTIRNSIGEKLTKQQTLKVSSGRKAEPLILDCDFLSTIALSQNIDNCAGVGNIKKDSDMTTTPTSTKLTAYTQEPQLHITIKESSHQSTSSLDTSQTGESITDTQSSDLLPTHGSLKILLNQNTLLPKVNGNVGSSTCNNSGVGVSNWYYIKERSPLFQSSALLSPDNLLKGNSQLAHIKMRISLNFDHVLNLSIYQPFQQMLETKLSGDLNGKSALEIILLFQNLSLDQEKLCKSLMKVMLYSGQIREFTRTLAVKYLSQGHDVNTLFRSQTMTTKVIHELMKFVGKSYLKSTLKKLIDIIMKEKKCCEVDPSKLKNKDDLEPNTRNLMLYAELAFTDMVDSCQKCPTLLQEIFSDLKELVLTFYPGRTDVQRLTISSFLVMRFFATAILNPKQYGLVKEQPKDDVNRTLLLVSKILQKVTNSVVSGRSLINKEPWLTPILNRFENESHQNSMIQFLDMISHSSDLTKSEQVDDNIMGILKDGYVVERHNRSERLRTFKRFISTKHRYLVLHPNELCWQKKKDTGESEIKGTLCLEDITDVSTLNSDDNTFKVATSQKEVTFQTKTLIERNDWLIHIQKQQHRQAMKTMSQTDVIEIADIDIERELEIIHTLLYKKIKELKQYDVSCGNVIGIDNKLTAEDHKQILVNNIPEPIIDQLYLDKTNSEWLSNCKSFKGICSDIIQMIEKIEKEHTYTIGKILNSSKVAPDKIKDEFYNDENYLLLASRIKGNAK